MLKTGSHSSCRCNDFKSSSRNKQNLFYITYKNCIESDRTLIDLKAVPEKPPLDGCASTVAIDDKCESSVENRAIEVVTGNSPALVKTTAISVQENTYSLSKANLPVSNLIDNIMPSAQAQAPSLGPQAVIVRSTTTAEILDENRFSMLDKSPNDGFEASDLPLPPNHNEGTQNDSNAIDMEMKLLNTSCGTSVSVTSTPSSSASPKKDNISTASSSISSNKRRKNATTSNQGDVNSIESISESTYPTLAVGTKATHVLDVDWIDDLLVSSNNSQQSQTTPQKAINEALLAAEYRVNMKKQKIKERDQLDGVTLRLTRNDDNSKHNQGQEQDDDDKVVKCLYYTLMCCECTIS